MTSLPNWVYDLVNALEVHADEHPKFYRMTTDAMYAPVGDCGCKALDLVPVAVRDQAKAIASYVHEVTA